MTLRRKLARIGLILGCAVVVLLLGIAWRAGRSSGGSAPIVRADFHLRDTAGRSVSLTDFQDKQAIVLVFVGTECPLVNHYFLRLAEIQNEFGPHGVQVLAINSNCQDSPRQIARHARQRQLPFPVLIDPKQKVADLLGAKRTPEAFLLDRTGAVRYHGRIDDRYTVGGDRGRATREDLIEAIRDVLAARPVRVSRTPVVGCFIGRDGEASEPAAEVTYARDVAVVLQKHCQECHRPGQVAPFSLLSYEQARAWSATIGEVVRDGRMPPWHADPRHGSFANDRSLPEADRETLLDWIALGCPKGDESELPPPRTFPEGWAIGKPDLILSMAKPFTVPAKAPQGGVPYQKFVLSTGFEQDTWVQAVEVRPGNRAVVHHVLVYLGDPANLKAQTADRPILAGFVPGARPAVYPKGLARRIPRGTKLVMEVHYTANGTEQTDLSSIGLVFSKEPPKHELRTRFVVDRTFAIPAGARDHEVKATTTFDCEAVILSLTPHLHVRGKSFLFRAIFPDGRSEVLLSVPRYDFEWQHTYALKRPLRVPAGTKIECVGRFDNSADNPNNPDPSVVVRWGEQSREEMMLGVIGYYDPKE